MRTGLRRVGLSSRRLSALLAVLATLCALVGMTSLNADRRPTYAATTPAACATSTSPATVAGITWAVKTGTNAAGATACLLDIEPNPSAANPGLLPTSGFPWAATAYASEINAIAAPTTTSPAIYASGSMDNMFKGLTALSDLSGLAGWNTSAATSMGSAFYGDTSLRNLNGLQKWATAKVTNTGAMFYQDSALSDVSALAAWNLSSDTNLSSMFASDTALVFPASGSSGFFTLFTALGSATNFSSMFSDDTALTNVDSLVTWGSTTAMGTSQVTTLAQMFMDTPALTNINGLANLNTGSVTSMFQMFFFPAKLGGQKANQTTALADITGLAKWDVSKVCNYYTGISAGQTVSTCPPASSTANFTTNGYYQMFQGNRNIQQASFPPSWNDSHDMEDLMEMKLPDGWKYQGSDSLASPCGLSVSSVCDSTVELLSLYDGTGPAGVSTGPEWVLNASATAKSPDCSYGDTQSTVADTGGYSPAASQMCWINFDGMGLSSPSPSQPTVTSAKSVFNLPGGFTMTAHVSVTDSLLDYQGSFDALTGQPLQFLDYTTGAVSATQSVPQCQIDALKSVSTNFIISSLPVLSRSGNPYLTALGSGTYQGISGMTAMYGGVGKSGSMSSACSGLVPKVYHVPDYTVNFTGISVTDSFGNPVKNFSLAIANAEEDNPGEGLQISSDGVITADRAQSFFNMNSTYPQTAVNPVYPYCSSQTVYLDTGLPNSATCSNPYTNAPSDVRDSFMSVQSPSAVSFTGLESVGFDTTTGAITSSGAEAFSIAVQYSALTLTKSVSADGGQTWFSGVPGYDVNGNVSSLLGPEQYAANWAASTLSGKATPADTITVYSGSSASGTPLATTTVSASGAWSWRWPAGAVPNGQVLTVVESGQSDYTSQITVSNQVCPAYSSANPGTCTNWPNKDGSGNAITAGSQIQYKYTVSNPWLYPVTNVGLQEGGPASYTGEDAVGFSGHGTPPGSLADSSQPDASPSPNQITCPSSVARGSGAALKDGSYWNSGIVGTLNPNDSISCTGQYAVAGDDNGLNSPPLAKVYSVLNTAQATGVDSSSGETLYSNYSTASVGSRAAGQTLVKGATTSTTVTGSDGQPDYYATCAPTKTSATPVCDTVTYSFTITNIGQQSLVNPELVDHTASNSWTDNSVNPPVAYDESTYWGGAGRLSALACPTTHGGSGAYANQLTSATSPNAGGQYTLTGVSLAAGDSLTCTATYVVSQTDIDKGPGLTDVKGTTTPYVLNNTATVNAVAQDGSVVWTLPSSAAVNLYQVSNDITKRSNVDPALGYLWGQPVTWTMTDTWHVKGNWPLNSPTIVDNLNAQPLSPSNPNGAGPGGASDHLNSSTDADTSGLAALNCQAPTVTAAADDPLDQTGVLTCTGTYTTTKNDYHNADPQVDPATGQYTKGSLTNFATFQAEQPDGTPLTSNGLADNGLPLCAAAGSGTAAGADGTPNGLGTGSQTICTEASDTIHAADIVVPTGSFGVGTLSGACLLVVAGVAAALSALFALWGYRRWPGFVLACFVRPVCRGHHLRGGGHCG